MTSAQRPPVAEIQAKTLLIRNRDPAAWFGTDYSMNLYRGCHHQCIYCDSRSECYGIGDFGTVQVKVNALDLLRKELRGKRPGLVIGSGGYGRRSRSPSPPRTTPWRPRSSRSPRAPPGALRPWPG